MGGESRLLQRFGSTALTFVSARLCKPVPVRALFTWNCKQCSPSSSTNALAQEVRMPNRCASHKPGLASHCLLAANVRRDED